MNTTPFKRSIDDDWPAAGLERILACPVCRSRAREPLHRALEDETFHTAPGRWDLFRCRSCASAYLDPRPSEDTIGLAYERYYTHGDSPAPTDGRLKAALRRVIDRWSSAYERQRLLRSPVTRLDRWRANVVAAIGPAREVLDAKYRHLRSDSARLRVLDVGCGDGAFLRRARDIGCDTEGIDFDANAVAAARRQGFDVTLGSIDTYSDLRDAFDVITCNHVIEHVPDALHLLRALHRLLKPGGLLWLETPNVDAVGHELFGRHWRGLEVPRHVTIFSHQGLLRSVREAGFEIRNATPWNFKHILYMHAASRQLQTSAGVGVGRVASHFRALSMLVREALNPARREFVLVRCRKP